ncbi:MAG: hypothetical protein Q9193_005999, partial [Seirophora villosa]
MSTMTNGDLAGPKPDGVQKPVQGPLDATEIWKKAPILMGTTKFDPLPDVGTIMITGGAGFIFFQGDIANPADVTACLEKYQVDTIFHFAAQSHVDLSFGNSYSFTATNVYGTHVMLECAKAAAIRRFVHISTDEVYGEVDEDSEDLMESSILAPTNPYAASKAAAEMLVNAYWKSFKLPVMIARSNNVYGPHQYPE